MYCLSFYLNFLKTPLVSSNSSYPSRASELNPGFCGVHPMNPERQEEFEDTKGVFRTFKWNDRQYIHNFLKNCLFVRFTVTTRQLEERSTQMYTKSSVFCVVFCRSLFLVFFVHCIVCPSIYRFW
jgi:hypothetical protein